MDTLLVDLLPLIIGATLAPIYPIVVLLLLQSERGLVNAIAFFIGAVTMRLLQGVVFGLVLAPAVEAESEAGLYLLSPILLTVAGVLLLVMGVKKWLKESTEDDGDQLPGWMSAVMGLTMIKAVGWGALLMLVSVKQWVFTLSAISVIEEAQPGMMAGIGIYLLYMMATQVLVLPPIVAFAVAPQRSAVPLQAAQGWLQRHNGVIVMSVSFVFGVFFSIRGIAGLIAAFAV